MDESKPRNLRSFLLGDGKSQQSGSQERLMIVLHGQVLEDFKAAQVTLDQADPVKCLAALLKKTVG